MENLSFTFKIFISLKEDFFSYLLIHDKFNLNSLITAKGRLKMQQQKFLSDILEYSIEKNVKFYYRQYKFDRNKFMSSRKKQRLAIHNIKFKEVHNFLLPYQGKYILLACQYIRNYYFRNYYYFCKKNLIIVCPQ